MRENRLIGYTASSFTSDSGFNPNNTPIVKPTTSPYIGSVQKVDTGTPVGVNIYTGEKAPTTADGHPTSSGMTDQEALQADVLRRSTDPVQQSQDAWNKWFDQRLSGNAPAEFPGVQTPYTPGRVLSGQQLIDAAQRRREDTLRAAGLGSDNVFRQALDKGGKFSGSDQNGPYLMMPDGTKVYSQMNYASTAHLVSMYEGTTVENAKKDVMNEQEQKYAQDTAKNNAATDVANKKAQSMVTGPDGTKTTGPTSDTTGTKAPSSKVTISLLRASDEINSSLTAIKAMSPETYNAYLPGIQARLSQITSLRSDLESANNEDVTQDPVVKAAQTAADSMQRTQDARLIQDETIAQQAEEIKLDVARQVKEAGELDQQILQAKQNEDEQNQISLNMANEATARRSVIRAGVADDSNALKNLSDVVQAGVSKLAALRQANGLERLKASLAIGQAYTKTVSEALNTLESDRSKLEAAHDDAITKSTDVVTQKTAEATKSKKERLKTLADGIAKLETEAGDKIAEAQKEMAAEQDRKTAHQDAKEARSESLATRLQAHKDAMIQHDDTVTRTEIDSWTKTGRQWAQKLTDDIADKGKSPAIGTYDDLNILYGKWQSATNNGKLDITNPATSTLMVDLFANMNNPKLTARMPSQAVDLLKSNLSAAQKGVGFVTKLFGGGQIAGSVLVEMKNAVEKMHDAAKQEAQEEMDTYIVKAIHQNSTIPEKYRAFGIDQSDLLHGDLTIQSTLSDGGLGNTETTTQEKPPNDSDIMNGTTDSQGSFSPSEEKMNTTKTENGNIDISNSTLGDYVSSNGFRVTQGFNGMYDKKKGYMKGEHGAYDIAPPKPGETPSIPAFTAGNVIEVGTSGPYGNHIKIDAGNGITYLYGHMKSLNVKKGDTLTQGQDVGVMGSTGQSDGVHLHLQAFKDGKPFDFLAKKPSTELAYNQ